MMVRLLFLRLRFCLWLNMVRFSIPFLCIAWR